MRDPMLPEPFHIDRVHRETHDTFTLQLEPAQSSSLKSFVPGQFNMLYAFGVGEIAYFLEASRATSGGIQALRNFSSVHDAKIVPPTAQNQKTIEKDLSEFVPRHLQLPDDKLTWQCVQAIRNYDPCISCATHFLKLDITRL